MHIIHTQNLDLKQIADSGQCFRMTMESDIKARIIACGRLLYLTDKGEGKFELSCTGKEYNDLNTACHDDVIDCIDHLENDLENTASDA